MGFGMTELIVVLVIVLLLFGTKKLKTLGGDLGTAIKGFKNAMATEEPAKLEADTPVPMEAGQTAQNKATEEPVQSTSKS